MSYTISSISEPTAGQSLCGNGRRDRGEECDPGEATDYCCTKDCTLQPNAECRYEWSIKIVVSGKHVNKRHQEFGIKILVFLPPLNMKD